MTKKIFLISLLAILIVALINTTIVHATEIDVEEADSEIIDNYSSATEKEGKLADGLEDTLISVQQSSNTSNTKQSINTVGSETEKTSNKVTTTGAIEEGITDGTGTLPQTGKVADIIVNSLYVLIIGCSICLVVVLISSVKEK